MKLFKLRIKERGCDTILTPELAGDFTREYAEQWFGVHDPDVEWYEIEEKDL